VIGKISEQQIEVFDGNVHDVDVCYAIVDNDDTEERCVFMYVSNNDNDNLVEIMFTRGELQAMIDKIDSDEE